MEREYYARENQRYVKVSPGAIYESQLQQLVARNVGALFPEYFGTLMDPLFKTPAGDVQPDLVLVRADGRGWALVEVEVEGHSFSAHILPQLTKLMYAESSSRLVERLADRLPGVPRGVIRTGLSFRPAVYLVIQGSSVVEENRLRKLGVEIRDVEVLKAPDRPNEYVLFVVDRTVRLRELSVKAIRDTSPMTKNFWRIADTSLLPLVTSNRKIVVQIVGTWAEWPASVQADEVLIRQPSGLSSSSADVDSLVCARVFVDDENEMLYLEPAEGTL